MGRRIFRLSALDIGQIPASAGHYDRAMKAWPPGRALLADLNPFGPLFVGVVNRRTRGRGLEQTLAALEGKRICIRATDLPLTLTLAVRGGRLEAAPARATPHVTLRGRLIDLARLASRAEDPDTLFFQRRLRFEGETETALAIKNALDALEWPWPRDARDFAPRRLATALRATLRLLPCSPFAPSEPRRPGSR
jgi:predicted lipid carrier protein YhbT